MLLFLLSLLIFVNSQNSVEISNKTINLATTYTIRITIDSSTLNSSGKLSILFPSRGYTSSQLASVTCNYNCDVSGITVSINNSLIPTTLSIVTLTLNNVINPNNVLSNPSTQNLTITLSVSNTGNQSALISLGVFTAGVLQSCSVSFSPGTVNTTSSAYFTILTSNPVSSGRLFIDVPNYWTNSYTTTSTTYVVVTTCPINLSCSYSQLFQRTLIMSNITVSSNTTLGLNFSSIISPPTSLINTQLSARTTDNDSNAIDSSVYCTISALTPNTLTISITNSSIIVNNNFTPTFTFTNTDPIAVGDVIRITLSSFISSINTSTLTFNGTGINSNLSLITSSTYNYTLTNSSSTTSIVSGNSITLTGLTFLSLPYSKTISNAFTITLTRNGSSYSTGASSITFIPNTISVISVSLSNSTVQRSSNYTITFTTITSLSTSSLIVLDMPATTYIVSCPTVITINGVSNTLACDYSNTSHMIISSFLSSTLSSSSNISFTFLGRTPYSTQARTISLSTIYNSSLYNSSAAEGITDQGIVTFTPTAVVASCNIVPGSYVIGAVSIYTMTCVMSTNISAATLVIVVPNEIELLSNLTVNLTANGTQISNLVTSATSQTITISNFTLTSSTTLVIRISNLRNPQNYTTTSSFSTTFSYQTYTVQTLTTSLTITMNTSATFNSLSITPQSQMNGETTSYNISINSSITIYSGHILYITLPSSVSISSPSCNSSAITCSASSGVLQIHFSTTYIYYQQILLIVSGFTNPRTLATTGTFSFVMNRSSVLYQSGTSVGITNTLPNYIQTLTTTLTSPNQSYLNSVQTILFTVVTKNYVVFTSGEYLNLAIPSSFNTSSMYCLSPFSCSASGSVVKVTSSNATTSSNISFSMVDLRTSTTYTALQSGTTVFSTSTYTSSNSSIDISNSSTQVQFTLSCDSSCRTCSTTDIFSCTSCYTNATLINNICNLCLDGQYKDSSTGDCYSCNTICSTCFGTSTNCTSCTGSYYLYNYNCVNASSCPSQTIPLSNICQSCSSTCNGCQNTTTNCITCASGYLNKNVNSTECVSECDAGLVKYNGICQCYQCLTCSSVYTNCTSCDALSSNRYLYNNTCLSDCPLKTYGSSTVCLSCMEGCTICTSSTDCQDDVLNSLTSKLIPVPFTLAIILIGILAGLSRVISDQTFIPSFMISIGGVLEVLCWIVILGILGYFEQTSYRTIGKGLIAAGLGVNYILNLVNLFIFYKYLMADKAFSIWFRKQSSKINNRVSLAMSVLFNHRYIHIFFSKAFNSQSLRAPLDNPKSIIPTYIITGLGFISEILVIAGCANISYDPKTSNRTQLFMQSIDAIIINLIIIIFTSWNFIKPSDFFKPFEIVKYNDSDNFKNNETIEDLHDNYLENLEIEQVTGGIGGRPRYANTRLHLEGLNQQALVKNKQSIVNNSIGKVVLEDSGSVIAHRLLTKVLDRSQQLAGISESSEDEGSRQPLSPQKQPERPKINVNQTDFEKKNERVRQELSDEISISNESLVRYETPLDVEEVSIIFAHKKGDVSKSSKLQTLNDKSELNSEQQNPLNKNKKKRRRNNKKGKRNKHNLSDSPVNNRNPNDSNLSNSDIEQQDDDDSNQLDEQSEGSFDLPQNYDQEDVPERPVVLENQVDYSTNLDNIPSPTHYNRGKRNSIQTNYGFHKYQGREKNQNLKSMNQTTIGFRQKKNSEELGLREEDQEYGEGLYEGGYNEGGYNEEYQGPYLERNSDGIQVNQELNNPFGKKGEWKKQLFLQQRHSNPNLPHHKFQRYFQQQSDSLFQAQSNQLSYQKQTMSSVGSIKKTTNPLRTQQDIKRDILSRNILAPETPARHVLAPQLPMQLPRLPPVNSSGSITQPLATIMEHQAHRSFFEPIKIQYPVNDKLKVYLEKLQMKDKKPNRK